jgi:hypothetical protein
MSDFVKMWCPVCERQTMHMHGDDDMECTQPEHFWTLSRGIALELKD